MTGPCETCRFYRRPSPLSQALLHSVGGVRDQPTLDVFLRMTQAEESQLAQEAKYLASETDDNSGSDRRHRWPFQPRMTPYCGRHESEGIFEIATKKNAGLGCGDHQPGRPPWRPCSSCIHRAAPVGDSVDSFMYEQAYRVRHHGLQVNPPDGQAAQQIFANAAARKSAEIGMAFYADGRLTQQPKYLNWCRKLSRPEYSDYWVCEAINPKSDCAGWERFSYGQ
jgi:hypothetical protein